MPETDNSDTGNAILNALLHEKCRFSEFYQIEWETCIDLNYTTPLKDFDLCTIFGNAIDNAMEACLNMDASENRYIRIFTGKIRKFLIIKIENSKKEEALPLDSEIRSTKAEASSHGYGLKSIRRTVHKYNGEMAVFLNRTSFTLRIAIPLSSAAS